ncbi:phosphate ABC transporter permease subunit PstC [bacterium]|nr:phosphate ABC transporter permease subunit PstC [bacterium]
MSASAPPLDAPGEKNPPASGSPSFSPKAVRDRVRHSTPFIQRLKEFAIEKLLALSGWLSILFILLIFVFLFKEGLLALRQVESLSTFFYSVEPVMAYDAATAETKIVGEAVAYKWEPVSTPPRLSILPLLWGSFGVALLSAVLSTLSGIAVGVFLSEMASEKTRNLVKPALELLVGIPTVVIGFFMLTVVAIPLKNILNPADGTSLIPAYQSLYNMFVGSLGVSVVIVPVIASLVDDALRAVPMDLRAASLSLGATRWQTTWRVVLPAGVSGVLSAVILGFGRAIGETMIVLMCAGSAPQISLNPFDSTRTMTATIAAEMGAAQQGSLHMHTLFLVGAILVTLAFFLNLTVELIANHYRKKIRL